MRGRYSLVNIFRLLLFFPNRSKPTENPFNVIKYTYSYLRLISGNVQQMQYIFIVVGKKIPIFEWRFRLIPFFFLSCTHFSHSKQMIRPELCVSCFCIRFYPRQMQYVY